MALLDIIVAPDPRLKRKAARVESVDAATAKLMADMLETMYEAPGTGLAATQVDVHQQVVVIDISEEKNQLLTLINARITTRDGFQVGEEGCLSVPGIYDKVERAERVTIHYQDLDGKEQKMAAEGLLAVCIQHEIDHLKGKVFVEYLSQLKQTRVRAKLAKQQRKSA